MTTPKEEIARLAVEIIPSLAANGLSWVFGKALRGWLPATTVPKEKIREQILRNDDVATILQKASASIARAFHGNRHYIVALKQFLISPEMEAILRQIYSVKLTSTSSGAQLEDIRAAFTLQAALHINASEQTIEELCPSLFDALVAACQEGLNRAISAGSLEALEAKNALRHNIMLEELSSVRRNIDLLRSNPRLELSEITKFETKLRIAIEQRHGFIIPPNLSSAKKVPVDDLYVPSNFSPIPQKGIASSAHHASGYPTSRFWNLIDRTVVLGNPGAGKSTFSQKLCYTLAKEYSSRPMGNRLLSPILVVLRDYGAEKKERQVSILQFMESMVNAKYQVKPPQTALEYLLLNGRMLVVFDGLDELLDTAYRREVTDDVEVFSTLYPATPILVTSREVGYDQAPLDKRRFRVYRIAEFDEDQVRAYVGKWFGIDEDLSLQEKKDMPRAFLDESRSVVDLRCNPLMLGLMCSIYRGETYIPRNRPGVYEKCALMLFEKWDRSRRISVEFAFEDKLSPVMKYLALWIYSDVQLQTGVTETQLIEKATEYLHKRYFEDIDAARGKAKEFIEFCRGRAWIFTDTGSTTQESLYQFTHRTFLEYFTAAHLVRIYPVPDLLSATLIPKIRNREWDIVAQLAFQLQANQVEGAGDALCQLVLKSAKAVNAGELWATASFLARCLEFLMPSPNIVRDIALFCVKMSLDNSATRLSEATQHHPLFRNSMPYEIWIALSTSALENRSIITDTMNAALVNAIGQIEPLLGAAAIDAACHLPFIARLGPRAVSEKQEENLSRIRADILESSPTQIAYHSRSVPSAALIAFHFNKITADQVFEWHGMNGFFFEFRSITFPIAYPSVVDRLLKPSPKERRWSAENLDRLAPKLEAASMPWLTTREIGLFSRVRFPQRHRIPGINTNGNILFAAFCLFAVLLESFENRRSIVDVAAFIKKTKNPQIVATRELLLRRITPDVNSEQSIHKKDRLSIGQREIVQKWGNREISFIGRQAAKRNVQTGLPDLKSGQPFLDDPA